MFGSKPHYDRHLAPYSISLELAPENIEAEMFLILFHSSRLLPHIPQRLGGKCSKLHCGALRQMYQYGVRTTEAIQTRPCPLTPTSDSPSLRTRSNI